MATRGEGARPTAWPAVQYETLRWAPAGRPPRADRLLRHFDAAVPPPIAASEPVVGAATAGLNELAAAAIVRLDTEVGRHLVDVAGAMLRSESVASSKMERLETSSQDLGVAALRAGNRRAGATLVLRNVEAMQHALQIADRPTPFTVDDLLDMQRVLLRDDPYEAAAAGRVRTEQNWVGGSDHSPRGALFVPPAPERVEELLRDLVVFLNRTDLGALPQAMIAHAQFETIHPFTDGNGRTGRALIHAVLRRRGLARTVAVPASAALLVDTDAYFASLGAYRSGDLDGYLSHVALATERAAREAHGLADELAAIRIRWDSAIQAKPGTLVTELLELIRHQPVVDAATLGAVRSVNRSTLYRAIDALVAADVLVEITGDRRHQIWAAHELLDAVDAFNARLGRRS